MMGRRADRSANVLANIRWAHIFRKQIIFPEIETLVHFHCELRELKCTRVRSVLVYIAANEIITFRLSGSDNRQ